MMKGEDTYIHDTGCSTSSLDQYYSDYGVGSFLKMARYLMYVFNTIFFAFASMLFSLCLWAKFHKDIDDYVISVDFTHYWDGVIVLMVGAMVVMVAVFVGVIGTYFWNRTLIGAYFIICVMSIIVDLGGAASLLSVGLRSTQATPHIQERFRSLIWHYNNDDEAKRRVDNIQEHIGCCGGYSTRDWDEIHMPVPNSCRDRVTGNQHHYTCAEMLSLYLQLRTGWICGIALCLCFLQLFTLLFALCIYRGIKERRAAYQESYRKE